ncbi:MAG: phage virion morphogenesis protein [Zoogloeaceae bacterium]|jgi:hypothetical protein|nr:phage virion morphogenesis protein [Zoogloeaceae bacterium]
MPLYVSVDDKQVLEVLQRIAERFQPKQMRPAMMQIGEKLLASTKKRFDMAVAPDGTPWAPIKPGTILARIPPRGFRAMDQVTCKGSNRALAHTCHPRKRTSIPAGSPYPPVFANNAQATNDITM